jgi:hypothetical protein
MARAPKSKPAPQNHNEAEILEIIKEVTDKNFTLANQRKAINDKITANLARVKALNIDMVAYKAGAKRYKMDPDVRIEFDRSVTQVNLALGIPVQADLFADTNEGDAGGIPEGAL